MLKEELITTKDDGTEQAAPQADTFKMPTNDGTVGRNRLLTTIDQHSLVVNFRGGLSKWTAERGMVVYWLQSWKEVVGAVIDGKLYIRLSITSGAGRVFDIDRSMIDAMRTDMGINDIDKIVICDSTIWRWVETKLRVVRPLPPEVRSSTWVCDVHKEHIVLPESPFMSSWEKTGEMICPYCYMEGEINAVSLLALGEKKGKIEVTKSEPTVDTIGLPENI